MNTNESPFDLAAVMVSTFANAQNPTPTNHRPVLDELAEIRNGTHRADIAAVRSAYAQGGRDAAAPLKKALPCFTAAGTFTRRANDAIETRSGLIVADLDGLKNERLAAVRAQIEADPFTLAVFTSPTGTGLKVLYRCNLTRPHAEAFTAMGAHVLALTGERIDESGSDLARLCFVSDDPALFINAAAQVLPAAPAATVEVEPKPEAPDLLDSLDAGHGKPDAETVVALLACIPPHPPYLQWHRINSAVWDALGEDAGCDALEAWSPEENPNGYRSKYRHRLPTVRAGTLFYIAEGHDPKRVAAIKSGVGASGWFPAATWGDSFAAAWCAALEADATTPRPALAVRLLTTEAGKLPRNGFAPAEQTAARVRLVELAAAVSASGDKFAAAELEGIGCKLLGFGKVVFRAAVKAQTEAKQAEAEAVAQARALEALDGETGEKPLFFDGSSYYLNAQGAYGKICREDARLHINLAGLSKSGDPSPCDAKLHELQTRNRVDYAGPLCGRPAGLHNENGLRVLATRGPSIIETKAGAWPVIDSLLSNLLGRAAGDAHAETQKALLLAWIKTGREALRNPSEHRPAQVLALVGPPDCGKSLLQSAILTPALGGRCADPGLFFTGQTPFNADLWGAEHLAIGDKALDVNGSQRSELRNELKRVAAEPTYPLHGKGRDGLTFRPVWRVSLSANDDTESASNLPTLDASFADKIIYLKCYAPPAPFYSAQGAGERERFSAAIRTELPAFLHFVDGFEIPAKLRKARFGVTEWHHPAVLALLGEGDPLRPFADLLEAWIDTWPENAGFQLLPTIELFRILDTEAHGGLARQRLCYNSKHLGHLLAKLAEKPDWRGRLSHATKRAGGRTVNRSQACWRIEREDLL